MYTRFSSYNYLKWIYHNEYLSLRMKRKKRRFLCLVLLRDMGYLNILDDNELIRLDYTANLAEIFESTPVGNFFVEIREKQKIRVSKVYEE